MAYDWSAANEEYAEQIRPLIDAQVLANIKAVDAAAAHMLATPGDHGVVVTSNADGTVTARLSGKVAPMTINYAPTGVDL